MRFLRRSKPEKDDSQKALEDAEQKLEETKLFGNEVREVAQSLRHMRERNHFAEQLEWLMMRGGGQR